ncbi:TPR-MLP1-2 multi-domain protein [Pyrenophora tritici-repentis]|nr:TPR-MLP1-2 multi-domain protein [Pyrenophora tritici-repentis]
MMPNNQFLVPKTMSIPYDISSTIMTAVINPKDMGTITRATHNTLYAMPTTAISAVSAGRFATPSFRSIVPPTLLKNATAAYTAVHKSNIAVDLSAINWALGMTITASIGAAVVAHARRTPSVPLGMDAMRWRKLLHNIHSWLHQKLKSNASLRRELEDARRALEASASSQDELLKAQAELAALRQVLETDDKDDAELELNRFRDEIAQTKTTASVDKAQLKQALNQHEELEQIQDEELKDSKKAFDDLHAMLDLKLRDRKAVEDKLARDKTPMRSKLFGMFTSMSASRKDPGIMASPPPVPSSSPLPSMSVSENGQSQTRFSSGSEEPFPSSPAAESSQPTAKSSKAAAKIGFHSHPVSTPTQPTPAIYTTTTKPTPLSNKAEAKIPECTKSIHRKLGELMERLTSSASSNASSKRLRDIEDVEATPIQYKKPRLARQGSVFTPGGRPSVRLAIPELRPAEAGLKCVPSQDSTKICSSKEDKVIESVKVKTPVVAAKSLSEHSALVPVELQQDPVGDVVMGGSDDEAEVLSSFALAGVKSEASSRNSTSDIDMADSVQDVSIQPNVETTVAPTPSAPGTLRRRSKLPVPTNSPVRKSTRLAGMTQDLSEKSLRERSTSPLKTATTLSGKAGSQPPPSSKPAGVTKTSARQTRFVSPKKMDAVKSAAASPRKRK